MENFVKRFGVEGQQIKRRVLAAFNSAENFTQEEIDTVWKEAMTFIKTLPEEKRGAFYWNSGLEAFFLLTSEAKGELK